METTQDNRKNLAAEPEAECSDHPDAPHGFDRNASHNSGRYVCTCESWEPEANEHSISGAIAFTNGYYGGRCTVLPSNPAMVIPAGVPLYTRPEPARKPMTEDAEDEAFNIASKYAAWLETENRMLREARKPITKREMLTWYDELRPKSVADFVLGVRFAEKHHGIGGDDT